MKSAMVVKCGCWSQAKALNQIFNRLAGELQLQRADLELGHGGVSFKA